MLPSIGVAFQKYLKGIFFHTHTPNWPECAGQILKDKLRFGQLRTQVKTEFHQLACNVFHTKYNYAKVCTVDAIIFHK